MRSISAMLQHPYSISVPVQVHDQCLVNEEDTFAFMNAYVTPSDIQIWSVCLVLSHDTWLFRASRHSGVGAARKDNCNVTSFEKKYLSSSVMSCKSTEKLNVWFASSSHWRHNFHFITHTLQNMWNPEQVAQCGIALLFLEVFATKKLCDMLDSMRLEASQKSSVLDAMTNRAKILITKSNA